MKKLPMLAATAALTLFGCAHDKAEEQAKADEPSMQSLENEKTRAQQDRMDAPTVYEGEATGGAGNAVTTGDGQTWAPEEAPGDTVVRTPSDVDRSLERQRSRESAPGTEQNGNSQVTDEGKTDEAPQK